MSWGFSILGRWASTSINLQCTSNNNLSLAIMCYGVCYLMLARHTVRCWCQFHSIPELTLLYRLMTFLLHIGSTLLSTMIDGKIWEGTSDTLIWTAGEADFLFISVISHKIIHTIAPFKLYPKIIIAVGRVQFWCFEQTWTGDRWIVMSMIFSFLERF